MLLLLEEIRSQNNTQILLLQQLLSSKATRDEDSDIQDEFGLPIDALQQLQKIE